MPAKPAAPRLLHGATGAVKTSDFDGARPNRPMQKLGGGSALVPDGL